MMVDDMPVYDLTDISSFRAKQLDHLVYVAVVSMSTPEQNIKLVTNCGTQFGHVKIFIVYINCMFGITM